MGRYASGARWFFKPKSRIELCGGSELSGRGNFVHDPVTLKVIDERIARLYMVHDAIGCGRLKQCAQLHEMMARAA
jgi:hypothetical protein